MTTTRSRFLALVLIAVLALGGIGRSQQAPGNTPAAGEAELQASPLGVRQQRIKRMLSDLEGKFGELSDKLRAEQPEQAQKLDEAFKQSKDLLLMQRMDEITRLLDGAKLESADDEQNAIIGDLKTLIDLLLYEEDPFDKLMKEIEQLEAWKKELDNLIGEESELRDESEILEDKEAALGKLEEQIAKTKEVIEKQKSLEAKTSNDEAKDVDDLDALADAQLNLRKETQNLAKELKPEDAEGRQGAAEAAASALAEAVKDQSKAERSLSSGKTQEASASEKEALSDLEKALQELEKEKARIEGLDPEAAKKMTGAQNQAAQEASELGAQMSENQPEAMSEAQKNLENAQGQMAEAAKQLAENQPGQAGEKQEQAVDELKQARAEVEKQLNEKRDEAQKEQLQQLGEMFKKMLEKQEKVTAGTRAIAERRGGEEERLKRVDRIALRQESESQREVEKEAKAAEDLLTEDGTSVVFVDVVAYLNREMGFVAERMEAQETGTAVQLAHANIEMTLRELIASMENAQNQQQKPGDQGQQGQQGEGERQQNLFPPLAELKLLKFTQERINRQTKSYEQLRGNDPVLSDRELNSATVMQEKLTNMTRQLASKITPDTDPTNFD